MGDDSDDQSKSSDLLKSSGDAPPPHDSLDTHQGIPSVEAVMGSSLTEDKSEHSTTLPTSTQGISSDSPKEQETNSLPSFMPQNTGLSSNLPSSSVSQMPQNLGLSTGWPLTTSSQADASSNAASAVTLGQFGGLGGVPSDNSGFNFLDLQKQTEIMMQMQLQQLYFQKLLESHNVDNVTESNAQSNAESGEKFEQILATARQTSTDIAPKILESAHADFKPATNISEFSDAFDNSETSVPSAVGFVKPLVRSSNKRQPSIVGKKAAPLDVRLLQKDTSEGRVRKHMTPLQRKRLKMQQEQNSDSKVSNETSNINDIDMQNPPANPDPVPEDVQNSLDSLQSSSSSSSGLLKSRSRTSSHSSEGAGRGRVMKKEEHLPPTSHSPSSSFFSDLESMYQQKRLSRESLHSSASPSPAASRTDLSKPENQPESSFRADFYAFGGQPGNVFPISDTPSLSDDTPSIFTSESFPPLGPQLNGNSLHSQEKGKSPFSQPVPSSQHHPRSLLKIPFQPPSAKTSGAKAQHLMEHPQNQCVTTPNLNQSHSSFPAFHSRGPKTDSGNDTQIGRNHYDPWQDNGRSSSIESGKDEKVNAIASK